MNNYKKITVTIILLEIVLILGCNVLLLQKGRTSEDKTYLVDIKRAAEQLREGKAEREIDLANYKTLLRISRFQPEHLYQNDYRIESINGQLYCFEYEKEKDITGLWIVNGMFFFLLLITGVLLYLIGKKIIQPFDSMNYLVQELAKGNLSVPMKAEKSKLFGRFLWGLDMLRETLEQNKIREFALIKEKKTLILSLSHDIKTPLSAIELYAKALEQNLYQEEKRTELIKGIQHNTAEIKKYVNQITKASREEFLSLKVENKEFYLQDAMDIIEKYYKEKMYSNHTEYCVDKVQNCLIYGDLDRTVEVLQNVIENALKYGDGEKIHITFGEEEDCKLITVKNTGASLDGEELPHIFDSFYRGSNSTKVRGSGLGLYICKELLHKMDGDIFAKIKENTFCVTLVLRKM